MLFFSANIALSTPVFQDITEGATLYYNVADSTWSVAPKDGAVKFSKRYTIGENKFSEYVNDELGHDANSTREFIHNNNLIGYNKNTFKFHKIKFENGSLKQEVLNEKELKEIFPHHEIIRISQFKNNMIKIKRTPFVKKSYLIMNDTNTMFYNYQLTGADNSQEQFNCIFTPNWRGKIDLLPLEKSVTYTPYYIRLRYVL